MKNQFYFLILVLFLISNSIYFSFNSNATTLNDGISIASNESDCIYNSHLPSISIRVVVYIVRTDSGTGGYHPDSISTAISVANSDFSPYNISLSVLSTNYIDSDYYYSSSNYKTNWDKEEGLISDYENDYALDIFFVKNYGGGGYSYPFDEGICGLVIGDEYLGSNYYSKTVGTSILTHEIGHSLGLLHLNYITQPGCGTNDKVTDTPYYEHEINGQVDNDCDYIGSENTLQFSDLKLAEKNHIFEWKK